MGLKQLLVESNNLKEKIDSFGKWDSTILKKVNYKFRLDWNYYSNHMEGGTLTKEETRSVMVGNINIQGKPFKDVTEMNGHDSIVREILQVGKSEKRLSESRIKNIHSTIMFEEDISKKALIGNWKPYPNELINYRGEKIEFTPPGDVPNEIHDLLNKLNSQLDKFHARKSDIHPIIIASQFHLDFVTIHPFYDGNGRMSRILTNLILISCGLPPFIIRDIEKEKYYRYLADIQAYGGDSDLFHEFITKQVIDSQLLILKALEGHEIEEPDDLDKEIELFKREVNSLKTMESRKKDPAYLGQLFKDWINPFFTTVQFHHHKFDELFNENKYSKSYEIFDPVGQILGENELQPILDEKMNFVGDVEFFVINIEHNAYKKKDLDLFSLTHSIKIKPEDFSLKISDNYDFTAEFTYFQLPRDEGQTILVNQIILRFLETLKKRASKTE